MTFKADETVTVKGMTMPGTILSGPHKSPGADRWLVRKADGNVSLMKGVDITAMDARRETVARSLYAQMSGISTWTSLTLSMQESYLRIADGILGALDKTKPGPLKEGDSIRILADRVEGANVRKGDILTVISPNYYANGKTFTTDAPRSSYSTRRWYFGHSGEGVTWERA
ncbi:hypothetical protein ACIP6P_00620 [Streptomyces sp. NPDC088729]|uniref:hypothetical protein n=1 Tax=Streptomyces sp. NPDC088729 TaxID=3365876 RepID=UPI00382FBA82